jgi:hypothetical protein
MASIFVASVFIIYQQVYNKSNTTDATCRAGMTSIFVASVFIIYQGVCNKSSTTDATCRTGMGSIFVASVFIIYQQVITRVTRRMPRVEQESLTLPEHLTSSPDFNEARVARSL